MISHQHISLFTWINSIVPGRGIIQDHTLIDCLFIHSLKQYKYILAIICGHCHQYVHITFYYGYINSPSAATSALGRYSFIGMKERLSSKLREGHH